MCLAAPLEQDGSTWFSDRSCWPHRWPTSTKTAQEHRIVVLPRSGELGIAGVLSIRPSALQGCWVRHRQTAERPGPDDRRETRRTEMTWPAELVHVGTKIGVDFPGWRA